MDFKPGDLVEFAVDDGHDKVSCEGGMGYKLEPRARIKKIGLIVAWDQWTKAVSYTHLRAHET